MTLEPGTTLGRYQVLAPLGHGGMASVYRAYQPALERVVALKVLRPAYAEDPEFRERFAREAKAVARLRHPHIVQVHDFDEAAGYAFLVMEHVEGGTLKQKLAQLQREGQALPPREIARIVNEVGDALAHAHAQGIVHRDIKPSNVMLTRDGKAVVADFGIAKILAAAGQTQTGVGVGTPEYMSPEQGQGQHVDHRSDIYSLGVVAYELLTGRVPFSADTPLAVMLAHLRDPLPLPSRLNPKVGPRTEQVLLRALAKDPSERYASATAFAEALAEAVVLEMKDTVPTVLVRAGTTAQALPTPRALLIALPALSRRTLVGTIAAVVLVLGGGVVAVGLLNPPERARSEATPAPEEGRGLPSTTGIPTPGATSPAAAGQTTPPTAQTTTASRDTTPPGAAAIPTATLPATPPSAPPPVAAATLPPPTSAAATATLPPPTSAPAPTTFPPPTDPNAPKLAISGRATSALNGAPLAGIPVSAIATSPCCYSYWYATTDGTGGYRLNVPNGTYRIQFLPAATTGYAPQFYGGGTSVGRGKDVVVSGNSVTGIDVQLATGFLVSGRVTNASGGPPAISAVVSFNFEPCCDLIGGVGTDSNGRFQMRLPNGSYFLNFFRCLDARCSTGHETSTFTTATLSVNGRDVTGLTVQMP